MERFSILILLDKNNIKMFDNVGIKLLEKYVDVNTLDKIFILSDLPIYLYKFNNSILKDYLVFINKFDEIHKSNLIKSDIFIFIDGDTLLLQPLTYTDLFMNGKIKVYLQEYDKNKRLWDGLYNQYKYLGFENQYKTTFEMDNLELHEAFKNCNLDKNCNKRFIVHNAPLICSSQMIKNVSIDINPDYIRELYWMMILQFDNLHVYEYDETFWSMDLSKNTMHSSLPIEYTLDFIKNSIRDNTSKFYTHIICYDERVYELLQELLQL